jgi:hypothetical protein
MPKSAITLRTYIEILEKCSRGELRNLQHKYDPVLVSLRDEGLVSLLDSKSNAPLAAFISSDRELVVITPKGARTLIEWKGFINENTLIYKFFNGMTRLGWVLIGALSASLTDILKLIST